MVLPQTVLFTQKQHQHESDAVNVSYSTWQKHNHNDQNITGSIGL